ncbi:MAG: site-2 protease family protein [Candidatus Pacebacteria bacterium]|nr:site-2 protease family protein [Candidatus Paceibacterota bacterium]MBP9851181.1 site-2 protease family protein [Candidatus Paceibacterota bacterium]
MDAIDTIFYLAILIMSVVIHEVSHGFMAEYFGDKTARLAGRLTLNPVAHLDLFGSIILPAILYFTTGFAFGWARPVPYNPANLRNEKWGTIAVAAAGVLANLFIALFFGLLLRFLWPVFPTEKLIGFVSSIVIVNLALAFFNLVPIPPLDGSKILFNLLPGRFAQILATIEQYSFFILILFIFMFSQYLAPVIFGSFKLITGLGL